MVTSLHRYQEAGLPLGTYIQILYGLECMKNQIPFIHHDSFMISCITISDMVENEYFLLGLEQPPHLPC